MVESVADAVRGLELVQEFAPQRRRQAPSAISRAHARGCRGAGAAGEQVLFHVNAGSGPVSNPRNGVLRVARVLPHDMACRR